MTEQIHPLRAPDQMPPIRSQADLLQHWCALMGELGFGASSLWLQLITAEDRADHMLEHVDELLESRGARWPSRVPLRASRFPVRHRGRPLLGAR